MDVVAPWHLLILLVIVGLYFVPTFVGSARRSTRLGVVFAVNLLLGWSLIGWVVALVLALTSGTRRSTYALDMPSGQAPPGWYPTPQGGMAYWDGVRWLPLPPPTTP